ncbi:hypothetical protein MPDQ_007993 [Monascus purpureus]|uniref:Rhodopsin domain-containing protein n=1 Tax=Monascus purpureus TaxID=5098 RepID=A0A507QR20_MONPU|nr:hypothetical protein MPDQ_007993 [Monascus purpureus]
MSLVDDHASQYRAYILTPTDRRGVVVIAATLLMSWMVLLFLIRLYTRLGINGPLGVDDLLTGIGTIFGIAQVGVTLKAISYGFGSSQELLSPSQISNLDKDIYIADILFLLAHALAKASVASLLQRVDNDRKFRRLCLGVLVVIPLTILRAIYLTHALDSPDPSLEAVNTAITTQVLLHYSLMAATIPCLKPFVIAFNTGWGQGLIAREGKSYCYVRRSAAVACGNNNNDGPGQFGKSKNQHEREVPDGNNSIYRGHHDHRVGVSSPAGGDRAEAAPSIHSNDSQMMIIRQTQEWSVDVDIELRQWK